MTDENKTASAEHTDRPEEGITNGIPDGATEEEATALPHSHRQHSETAPAPSGGSEQAPKHDHNPSN